ILRDGIEIHLQWHEVMEWEVAIDRPMLRIVTQHIEALFEEFRDMEVFHAQTALRKTSWGTLEFAFYDPFQNGLTFYKSV
ncbi:MAG: glyoxalase/bleomycin resistance/extradiol dioxygenase family protein, partial [Flavobacteriaceae bacterium]